MKSQEMTICLWFDGQAEEAAKFYASIFPGAVIGQVSRFGKEGFEFHGKPEGTAMTVEFSLNGMKFVALNGGPLFRFTEAISIMIHCDTQEEIDHYWTKLTEGGEEQQCGWLKDKYGVSWQVNPTILPVYLNDKDTARRSRVAKMMFKMKKFDIKKLTDAYNETI
jgi:predicted 3-demethylubiquinone-9 3-methyltransferase (glyoxalase superfamily)